MAEAVNYVEAHRGKWDSWVTDTLTPVIIKDGRVYLTLGPPTKDPTNYFWTVLQDLQLLASTRALPDAELLLNFADTPVVHAEGAGKLSAPALPMSSTPPARLPSAQFCVAATCTSLTMAADDQATLRL